MLAIEIDGTSHEDKYHEDIDRQNRIEKYGITFLRFQDIEVKKNMEGVLGAIREWIYAKNHNIRHIN